MQIYRHSRNVKNPVQHKGNDAKIEDEIDNTYPRITYQSYKEIPLDEIRTLKIGTEQRRKK
jgi:hypothetical protein